MPDEGYFGFRKLVTNTIIKTVYALGVAAITVGGVGAIVLSALVYSSDPTQRNADLAVQYIVGGLAFIIMGNLLWRLICEGWIILFSVHEILASIEAKLKKDGELEAKLDFIARQLSATEQNNEQRHSELLTARRV